MVANIYLFIARHCDERFTWIISLNRTNDVYTIINLVLHQEKPRHL